MATWQIAQGAIVCDAAHVADGLWLMLMRTGWQSDTLVNQPALSVEPWGIEVSYYRASVRAPSGAHRVGLRGEIHELMSGGDWHLSIATGQLQHGWEAYHWQWPGGGLYVHHGLGLIIRPGGVVAGDRVHWACKYRVRGVH